MSERRSRKRSDSPQDSALEPLAGRLVVGNILEAIRDGVVIIDPEGVIALANSALGEIVGMPAEGLSGRHWSELFVDNPANQEFSHTISEVLHHQQLHYNRQVGFFTPDGRRKELIATTSLIQDQKQAFLGVVAVFKDVSELTSLHRRERLLLARSRRLLEERQESLDRVARAVAHEVRNPVTAIGGLAVRLLKEKDPDSKEASYLRRILGSSQRLEQVVAQVKTYADLPRPHLTPTSLGPWLEDLLEPFRAKAQKENVSLEMSTQEEAMAAIDVVVLAAALKHILDNALEATAAGGSIKVTLTPGHETHLITIADTGVGIDPKDIPFLFDPFFSTKAQAVGMSLALTKRIVIEHEGNLEVESTPGKGTTFSLSLPAPL
ncbi:MAG: ATP-binding protein [Desulfarculaceae bacterium]